MRILLGLLLGLIAVIAVGTGWLILQNSESPGKAEEPKPSAPAKPEPKATDPVEKEKPMKSDKPDRVAELPPVPKLGEKSKLTELNKEKTLYLETAEDGTKRVLFAAEVCLREGVFLEVFCCKKMTKEHESILNCDLDARYLHVALIATGAKVGKPVQFVNPKTQEAEYKPASGQKIKVSIFYEQDGKLASSVAQDWIIDKSTKKRMAHEWVFAGSRFVPNPDRPNEPPYYLANNGEVICLSNFAESMLDLPVEISREANDLVFEAAYKKIPPPGTKVWVAMEPMAEKK